jgi:membrane protease YdiL (CAAX protease family)
MSAKVFIKRHSVLIYFVLTFAISWGAILVLAGAGGLPLNTEQSKEMMPFIYMAMLVGPSIAGILMILLTDGKPGFRELLSRLTECRFGMGWYVVVLLATPILAVLILLAFSLFSPEYLPGIFTADTKTILLLSGITTGLMVGFFEELGWTGFAVPRLRKRFNIIKTGIIIGFVWGVWHFLVFWEIGSFSGAFPLAILLSRLLAWLPPFRILMVWVHDRTKSLLLIILMHTSLVAATLSVVPLTLAGGKLLTWLLTWGALLWIIVMVIAASNKGRLSQPIRN